MAKRNTKKLIIEGALQNLANLGFNSVTTHHISDYVGIRPSALYKHYKNLHTIFETAILDIGASLSSVANTSFGSAPSQANLVSLYRETSPHYLSVITHGLLHGEKYRAAIVSHIIEPIKQFWIEAGGDEELYHQTLKQLLGEVLLEGSAE